MDLIDEVLERIAGYERDFKAGILTQAELKHKLVEEYAVLHAATQEGIKDLRTRGGLGNLAADLLEEEEKKGSGNA